MSEKTLLQSALSAGDACLSVEELEHLQADTSTSHPHLASCFHCQTELALLKSFASPDPLPDEGAAVAWIANRLENRLTSITSSARLATVKHLEPGMTWIEQLSRLMATWWLVPSGVIALIVLLGVTLFVTERPPALQIDAALGASTLRSQEVILTGPGGTLTDVPATLDWKPVAEAATYKVELLEVDRTSFWEMRTKDNSLTIPGKVRDRLVPGKPILWRVTALGADGGVIGASQLERFVIARPDDAVPRSAPR